MIRVHVLDSQGFTLALFECGERQAERRMRSWLFGSDNKAMVHDDERGRAWEVTWDSGLRWHDLARQEALF